MPRKITFFKKSCTICIEDQKLSKSCQKDVKKLSKSCQKSCQKPKSCQKVAKQLPKVAKKSCQKVVKKVGKKMAKLKKV
jgi:hypothetical protein